MILPSLTRSSRRGALAAALVAFLAAFATASCSTQDSDQEASASALPAAEHATSYPLTLHTGWGDTVLEQRPERIVATGCTEVEALAALHVPVVLTAERCAAPFYVTEPLGENIPTYSFDPSHPYPYETIAAAEPDLIIAFGGLEDYYQDLASIAPVMSLADADQKYTDVTWQEMTQQIAEAMDLPSAGEAIIDSVADSFTQFRSDHPELSGLTLTYGKVYAKQPGLKLMNYNGSSAEAFFTALGYTPLQHPERYTEDQFVSGENIGTVDSDVLLLSASSDEAESAEHVTEQGLFPTLRSVLSLIHI